MSEVEQAEQGSVAPRIRPPLDVRFDALAPGITVLELARIIGSSVRMMERH